MSYPRAFKPSLIKRIFGWCVILLFGSMLILALLSNVQARNLDVGDLVIPAFLLAMTLIGVSILRSTFVLTDNEIDIVRLFRRRTYRVADLGGYNFLTTVLTGYFPRIGFLHVRLYGFGPKRVASFLVNWRDRDEVEKWLSSRLPAVIHDSNRPFSKPSYADEVGKRRDPVLRRS